jgi:hypothetical protein
MILKKNLMINNNPQIKIKKNSLSFRDPASRIYEIVNENGKLIKILRGLRKDSLNNFKELSENLFFKKFLKSEMVVKSELKILDDQNTEKIKEDGWEGVIEHEVLDFISYPYEWSFSMLKDSALLHLFIIKKSYENSWTLKDSSAYNVQWKNGKPIFIDLASFVPCNGDFKWIGYRQFCSMFLIPLLIKKYLDIDINNILRSNLDGVSLELGSKYFQSFNKFRKGVFSHIFIPNVLNLFINPDKKKNKKIIKQNKNHILSLMNSMYSLIQGLDYSKKESVWLGYDKKNSYDDENRILKEKFILKNVEGKKLNYLWDIGCNNGHYSKLLKKNFKKIIAFDSDHEVIENLYNSEKQHEHSNIIPLVINFSNPSPNQGWNNELKKLEERSRPEFILCLAFIHHARLVANIPIEQILDWLHSLNSKIIIEFVDRDDEMVIELLSNKEEKYEDYEKESFVKLLTTKFEIIDRQPLKNNKRELFYIINKNT